MAEGVQIQGLCRFSFPCTGGFKKYHESLDERRAALYAPKRLDERTLWFEHVFMPPLRAQTDSDFTMHLLLGEDFPEPWRSRVEAAIAGCPQVKAHWREPLFQNLRRRKPLHGQDFPAPALRLLRANTRCERPPP